MWYELLQQNERPKEKYSKYSVHPQVFENKWESLTFPPFGNVCLFMWIIYFSSFWKILKDHLASWHENRSYESPFPFFFGGSMLLGRKSPLMGKRKINSMCPTTHSKYSLFSDTTCYSYRTIFYISYWFIINWLYFWVLYTMERNIKRKI